MILSLPINELFGDDAADDEKPRPWFHNVNLYLSLPLLFLNTLLLVALAAPALPLSLGGLAYALEPARANTGAWDLLGGSLTLGLFYAVAAIPAHDLTHRVNSRAAQVIGRWLFAFTLDTTFPIAHVYGHHRHVGTKRDPATARRGENAYAFIVRSAYGQFVGAFRIEAERLRRKGHGVISFRNRAIRGQLMSAILCGFYFWIGGATGLAVFLATAMQGKIMVELLDYIAHYGLVRAETKSIEARHSWNMRRTISHGILLNAPRHSHHHLHPVKPFWALVAEAEAPYLPYGHTAMMMIAVVPPLWNAILDPLLKDWDLRFASAEERAILARDGTLLGYSRAELDLEYTEQCVDSRYPLKSRAVG
jgi:alkane 1-monooxygenase